MDAADAAAAGSSADGTLFCNLCFASDHGRSSCCLVMPVAAGAAPPGAVAAADVDSEEEEDPDELIFEDDLDGAAEPPADFGADFIPLPAAAAADDADEDFFLPIVDAADYLPAPDPASSDPASAGHSVSGSGPADFEDLETPVRPDHVDVYMPFVNLHHFDHIAYAFATPPIQNPDSLILQAADLGCGPDRVSLFPSFDVARVAVFASDMDREHAVNNGPFFGRDLRLLPSARRN
jgi:hypothetical protein